MQRNYELNLFLNPSLTKEEITKILEKIKNYMEEAKGVVLEIKEPDKRKLPYKMKKNKEGYYVLIRFTFEPTAVLNLRDKIKLTDGVIRSVISVAVEVKSAPENEEREEAVARGTAKEEKNDVDDSNSAGM